MLLWAAVPLYVSDTLSFRVSSAKHSDEEWRHWWNSHWWRGKAQLHLAMPQPLLCPTWTAFPRLGDGATQAAVPWNGSRQSGCNILTSRGTSGCKQHINTDDAEELAATHLLSSSFLFNRKTSGLCTMLNVLYASASLDSYWCMLMHGTPPQKLLRGYELLMTQKKPF